MRLTCPFCGARDLSEFTYQGDAERTRPAADASPEDWSAYVYGRTNPRGRHWELWLHAAGCRAHLAVERDTTNHTIHQVVFARDRAVSS